MDILAVASRLNKEGQSLETAEEMANILYETHEDITTGEDFERFKDDLGQVKDTVKGIEIKMEEASTKLSALEAKGAEATTRLDGIDSTQKSE